MSAQHTFLDRTALLLRACHESLTDADRSRLRKHGFKTYALQAASDPNVLIPDWLTKWASLILGGAYEMSMSRIDSAKSCRVRGI